MIRPIGEGGMGSVFLAHDSLLRRDVAVKTVMPVPGVLAEEFSSRFLNEARCVAALTHPNIVPVFDMGIENDVPFLVMEVVSGPSLRERLEDDERMAPRNARMLGIQVANALAAAHRAGIVHRDVKPANLLEAEPDQWKLVDFGVAHVPDSSITVAGQFLGTPTYAAPETLEGGEFSAASDVYGLGATLYEIVTGEPPYGRGTAVKIALEASAGPPRAIAERVQDVPFELAAVIESALVRDPRARPSAEEFARALAFAESTGERQVAPPAPVAAPRRGWGKVVAAVAVSAALVAGVVALRGVGGDAGGVVAGSPADGVGASPADVVAGSPANVVGGGAAAAKAEAPGDPGLVEAVFAGDEGAADDGDDAAGAEGDAADSEIASDTETAAATAPETTAPGLPEPGLKGLAKVENLVRRGAKTAALRELDRLRRGQPQSAYLPFLQGQLYFERSWWKDGFEAYGAAIRRDPAYRSHPPLVRDVIRNLSSKSQSWRGTRFLVREIGAAAVPHLEKARSGTRSAKIRQRIERVLAKLRR